MLFPIHGPLSQIKEPPRPGIEGLQGPLIPQQAQGSGSQFLRFPPPLTYFMFVTSLAEQNPIRHADGLVTEYFSPLYNWFLGQSILVTSKWSLGLALSELNSRQEVTAITSPPPPNGMCKLLFN